MDIVISINNDIFMQSLTIFTLTKNNAEFLDSLANALSEINDENLLWIVKDASNTKSALMYLKDLESSWDSATRFRYISSCDGGIYQGMNYAINYGSEVNTFHGTDAGYFVNFNPDDHVDIKGIRILLEILGSLKTRILVAPLRIQGKESINITRSFIGSPHFKGYRCRFDGCATSLIFSYSVFKDLGEFDVNYPMASDLDFMLKLIQTEEPVYYLDNPIGSYGVNGVSSRLSISQISELVQIYSKHLGVLSGLYLTAKAVVGRLL